MTRGEIGLSVPVEEVGDVGFQMTPFSGMEEVRLGFRVAGDGPDEHWLNRYAACLTATHMGHGSDATLRKETGSPYGKLCHTELMFQVQPNVWTRHSIYLGTYDEATGNIEPGKAHIKLVDDDTIFNKFSVNGETYEVVSFNVNREDQLNAMNFLVAQAGAPFNKRAYYWNMVPGFNFGTSKYDYHLNHTQSQWYCTELVTCALQAMTANPRTRQNLWWGDKIWAINANHSSPNLLYRTMKQTKEVKNALFRFSDRTTLDI